MPVKLNVMRCGASGGTVTGAGDLVPATTDPIEAFVDPGASTDDDDAPNGPNESANLKPSMASTGMPPSPAETLLELGAPLNSAITAAFAAATATALPLACTLATSPDAATALSTAWVESALVKVVAWTSASNACGFGDPTGVSTWLW